MISSLLLDGIAAMGCGLGAGLATIYCSSARGFKYNHDKHDSYCCFR